MYVVGAYTPMGLKWRFSQFIAVHCGCIHTQYLFMGVRAPIMYGMQGSFFEGKGGFAPTA